VPQWKGYHNMVKETKHNQKKKNKKVTINIEKRIKKR
jgi:hypothetical protein